MISIHGAGFLWGMRISVFLVIGLVVFTFCGCVKVEMEPIRVEPIQVEITINHKVQRELDDFFAEIDQASDTTDYVSTEEK